MRRLLLVAFPIALASCSSAQGAKETAKREYAVESYEQSLAAYQLCIAKNAAEPQKCGALAHVLEADKKRFEKAASGL
jgi:hypothetical protein